MRAGIGGTAALCALTSLLRYGNVTLPLPVRGAGFLLPQTLRLKKKGGFTHRGAIGIPWVFMVSRIENSHNDVASFANQAYTIFEFKTMAHEAHDERIGKNLLHRFDHP